MAQQAPAPQGGEEIVYTAEPTIDPLSTYTHICYRCKLTKKEAEENVQPPAPMPAPAEDNEPISPPIEPAPDPEPAPPPPPPPLDPVADSE